MEPLAEEPRDPQLERVLKGLPYPKAPAALANEVMARLRAGREVAWWHRPILNWPLAARCLGVAWLLALAWGVAYVLGAIPSHPSFIDGSVGSSNAAWGTIGTVAQVIASLGAALQACLSAVPVTIWWLLGATLAIAYFGCLAVGTLIYRRMFTSES